MQAMQIWEIGGLTLHPYPCAKERVHEQLRLPPSLAYFCVETGIIWARRIVLDEEGRVRPWMVYSELSPGRKPLFYPSGSLLSCIFDKSVWETLPPEILTREFLLYHDAILNGEI